MTPMSTVPQTQPVSLRLGYGTALLFPIIGFVLGAIAAARNVVGHGIGMMVTALAASGLWALLISDLLTKDQECSILVQGLCRDVPETIGAPQVLGAFLLVVLPLGLLISYWATRPGR